MRSEGIEVRFLELNLTGYVSLLEQKKGCTVVVPQPFWCVVNNHRNFKLSGITCLVGKKKFKLLSQGPGRLSEGN